MTLIHGVDSSSNVVPLLVDSAGHTIISASQLTTTGGKILVDASGNVSIVTPEPSILNPTPNSNRFQNLSLPAGTSIQTALTVPANQRYLLRGAGIIYQGTVAGVVLTLRINNGSNVLRLFQITPPVNDQAYVTICNVVMDAGWTIEGAVTGATLNDRLFVDYFTERIK